MSEITIDKKHIDFPALRHAGLAVAKDGSRPALQHIHMKENVAYGCDGYRAHYAPVTHFDDGLYFLEKCTKSEVTLRKAEEDLRYPDVTRIVPDNPALLTIIKDIAPNTLSLVLGKISHHKSDNETIYSVNYPYLVDATEWQSNHNTEDMKISIDVSAILIEGGGFSAIVMLLNIPVS